MTDDNYPPGFDPQDLDPPIPIEEPGDYSHAGCANGECGDC